MAPIRPSRSFIVLSANAATTTPGFRALLAWMGCVAVLALAAPAQADVAAHESFDYPTGAFLTGTPATGAGFTGTWTCGAAGTVIAGLTYTGLPVAHNALSSGAARQFVSFSNPLSTGTKWISFLFRTNPGNPGANINGVYFPNGGTGLWFGFGLNPYSPTQGQLGIGAMNTVGTAALGATSLLQLGLGTYGTTYLVAMEIQFNTSGNQDTVTVYLNPLANQSTPGVAAAGTYSAFDVGTITGVGLNVQGAGSIMVDEIRVGDTYSDVVGHDAGPPAAPIGLVAVAGNAQVVLSWTASANASDYTVKRSTDFAGPYVAIGATTAPVVTYTDSNGLTNGETYYYVVSATGLGGTSPDSEPVSATPVAPAPFQVAIARGRGISWFASNSVTYQVQWADTLLGTNTVWNNLGGSIPGNGATNTVFDPVGPPHNHYQVLAIQ